MTGGILIYKYATSLFHLKYVFSKKYVQQIFRSNHPELFLGKSILKICSKFKGENPCRSVISIKLQSNFIETTLRHGCSPLNLLHIFKTLFLKNTSGWLLLNAVTVLHKSYNQRSIQSSVKYLRWSSLRKYWTAESC